MGIRCFLRVVLFGFLLILGRLSFSFSRGVVFFTFLWWRFCRCWFFSITVLGGYVVDSVFLLLCFFGCRLDRVFLGLRYVGELLLEGFFRRLWIRFRVSYFYGLEVEG